MQLKTKNAESLQEQWRRLRKNRSRGNSHTGKSEKIRVIFLWKPGLIGIVVYGGMRVSNFFQGLNMKCSQKFFTIFLRKHRTEMEVYREESSEKIRKEEMDMGGSHRTGGCCLYFAFCESEKQEEKCE